MEIQKTSNSQSYLEKEEANRMEAAGGRGSLGSTWEGYNVIIMAKKGGSLKNPTFSQGEEMLEVVRESLRL